MCCGDFGVGRLPRLFIPGFPHHVVQRGHDRNAVFVNDSDFRYYLDNLIEWKAKYDISVYAYCLMTNHVHLILVPNTEGHTISKLMRRLSARQGRRVNRLERRVGTLWAGRFKSSVVDKDDYLMACLRYVELNPVRAGIVPRPEEYHWSSYAQRVGLCDHVWIDDDPATLTLGDTLATRRKAYAEFVKEGVSDGDSALIRKAVNRNQLTGGNRFTDEIERRTGIRVASRGPGRPNK